MNKYILLNIRRFVLFVLIIKYLALFSTTGMDQLEEGEEIVEQKISKTTGEPTIVKYKKGKMLGKGILSKKFRWICEML